MATGSITTPRLRERCLHPFQPDDLPDPPQGGTIFTMLLSLCKAKIHRATVTEANLHYMGSITIAEDLLEAAGLLPYERVQVLNINNAARLETYIIVGERGSGTICMNGPAAHYATPGDLVIIIAYAQMTPEEARDWHPTVVFVDEHNAVTRIARQEEERTIG